MKHDLWKKKIIMGSDQFPSLYISLIKTFTPKFRDKTEFFNSVLFKSNNNNNNINNNKELKTSDPKSKQKNRL